MILSRGSEFWIMSQKGNMSMRSLTRVAAAGGLALPLLFGSAGMAFAGEGHDKPAHDDKCYESCHGSWDGTTAFEYTKYEVTEYRHVVYTHLAYSTSGGGDNGGHHDKDKGHHDKDKDHNKKWGR